MYICDNKLGVCMLKPMNDRGDTWTRPCCRIGGSDFPAFIHFISFIKPTVDLTLPDPIAELLNTKDKPMKSTLSRKRCFDGCALPTAVALRRTLRLTLV